MTLQKFLTSLIFIAFCSCGQGSFVNIKKESIDTIPTTQFQPDSSKIAILTANESNTWLFKNTKPINLSNNELEKIEQLLVACINKHNAEQDTTKLFSEFIDLKKYKRQYVPYIDSTGDRKVYVNCFCTDDGGADYWRKKLVLVDDGGSCYFQLTINLTKMKYEYFSTNGYG